jgi:hypothetical protein
VIFDNVSANYEMGPVDGDDPLPPQGLPELEHSPPDEDDPFGPDN